MTRSLIVILAFTIVFATACASKPTPTPVAVPTPTAQPVATSTRTVAPTGTTAPQPTSQPTPAATETPAPLFLEVAAPANESVVSTQEVAVKGRTTPDAVVTINSLVAQVDAEGNFIAKVTLAEGPNTLEVLASDFHGNQVAQVVTVIYVPA